MDQDLPQASRLSHIRKGDNEPIKILASLFFISVISFADLYEGTMSAFFFALVLLATSKPNHVPGKAEEYSRIKKAIDFLVDFQRVRKSHISQENESVSRDNHNRLVIAPCRGNGNLKTLSRWKTVSVFFEFLFKIKKYSKQSKDCGSKENQLVVYSHPENEKAKAFSRWKTVSAFFEFFFKIRKYSKQPTKDCGSSKNTLAVYSHRESQTVKTFSRWKTVSAFFQFLYKMKKYCREAKEDDAVPSFVLLPSYNCGERENQLMVSSRQQKENVKASSRWKTVSAFFEFQYKIKKYCRAKEADGIPLYGMSIIKDTQKGKYHRGGFDALYKACAEYYRAKRIDKQLMICYRQEDKRLKAFNRWRAISRLFEFLYKIKKFCNKAKDYIVPSSRLPVIEDRQRDVCRGSVASNDVPEAFPKKDHQLAVSSHEENDSTKVFNRWRTVALSFEFLYKIRNSSEEFKKDYESTPYNPPVIKNWQKGKRCGSGAFCAVYEAFTESGFFFALKEVPLDTEDKWCSEKISHAEQEISLLSRFRHENIVRYLGSEKDDANFYIFLELVSQGSLSQLYKTYCLSDSQASRYVRDILRGLCYLHSHNVIHRDIKGDNVLVDLFGTAKLADFGLAKVTNLNDTKSFKGTSYWMAPEVVNSKNQAYGTSADIWSLGCTVLEILTRQHPYPKREPQQAMFRIGKGELPPIPTTLSINARDFIQRCLQVNPKDRPTAAELLHHPFVNNLPSTASSSST